MIKIHNSEIKGAILDMDGVLWRSQTPLCNLPKLFKNFQKISISLVLATNNGTHTINDYVEKLAGFGVQIEPSQIVTSTMAAAYLTRSLFPKGGPVYISGSQALFDTMIEYGFHHSENEPLAVVAGLKWDINYDDIKKTSLMIQRGYPFIFTNPDPTYPTPEGIVPGAGTILAALETASGVKAKVAGKPFPFLFDVALDRMGLNPDETMVVGDRLSTDILGGVNSGCKTVFVLSGVNSRKDLKNSNLVPDVTLENIKDLFDQTDYP